ncbi:MAG: beta-ketoacyl synthase N-terminal-like domain-containing protein, partial [Planctomycetota bacterium]
MLRSPVRCASSGSGVCCSCSLNTRLAIIGMACRLPGGDGLDEFWRLVVEGRSAVHELPESRLDRRLY